VTAEDDPHAGQVGRVSRVFWRGVVPWMAVRGRRGAVFAVPWGATDLPAPPPAPADDPGDEEAVLLSPAAVRALVQFVRQRRAEVAEHAGGAGDDRSVGRAHQPPRARQPGRAGSR